jgi:Cu(I)/Ag(I) efflux system membrane fusion protein/cobalt-zinc-cadmium efflux system membrane fusion protein
MNNTNPIKEPASGRRRGASIVGVTIALLSGFGLAWMILINPYEISFLTPISERLTGRTSPQPEAQHPPAESVQLWTCGMHPQVLQDEPGTCPICNMNLVRKAGGSASERTVLFYRNPMNPSVTSPVPMQDEMGMEYVPVYSDEASASGVDGAIVTLDRGTIQKMGVTTEPVGRSALRRQIRTVGYLDYDQEKMVSITTKYEGFVEKVYVNYLGQPVRPGDPLFEVYSPELIQTQQELLSALEFAQSMKDAPGHARHRAEGLVEAARTRLSYWDVTPQQVSRLESTRTVLRTFTVTAPVGGLVMKRMDGLEGAAIRSGMEVMHIADLSSLWLNVEVFEDQLPWLKPDDRAKVTLTYFPGRSFSARIRFIEPAVSEKTRTIKLTLQVPNPDGDLRSGMYATVEFNPTIVEDAIVVPSHAVFRTGRRNIVIVAQGGGRFAPREVELGPEGDGGVQVLSGLREGESLVTSSQFLIDSESNLREAIQQMLATRPDDSQ